VGVPDTDDGDIDEKVRFSPTALRLLRDRAGLSQRALAEALGVAIRTVNRYEEGAVEPRFTTALRMAEVLDVDMAELAGEPALADLGGQWRARWETSMDGRPVVTEQPVTAHDSGSRVPLSADRRGTIVGEDRPSNADDWKGYRWEGELRVTSDQVLIGYYVADDRGVRSRGSLYFLLASDASYAHGRWVGTSRDRLITTGWGVLARDDDRAGSIMTHLLADGRP
jgi:transcriptional regulator with XRE-family HTH domain